MIHPNNNASSVQQQVVMHTAMDISSTLRDVSKKPNRPKRPPHEEFQPAPQGVWQPPRTSVVIEGTTIPGGMFYTGTMLLARDGKTNDPALINTSLPIELHAQHRKPTVGMINPYAVSMQSSTSSQKTSWETLSPAERGQYIQWLANGRSEPVVPTSCLILYLYGLERRMLIDGPKERFSASENLMLIQEVQRIAATYGSRWEIKDVTNRILSIVWANSHDPRFASAVPAHCDLSCQSCMPVFPYYLATFTSHHESVPLPVMQHWFYSHPDIERDGNLNTNPNYQKLFKLLFEKEFANGYLVPETSRKLCISYQSVNPALGILEYEFSGVQDVFDEPNTLALFRSIMDRSRASLREYEEQLRLQEINPIGSLLKQPIDVRASSPALRGLGQYLSQFANNSVGCITVRGIYRAMGFKIPEKIDAQIADDIGKLLEMSCFQYAPNPRMHKHAFNIDDQILITPALTQPECNKACEVLSVILRLGAIVAQSDEEVSQPEIDVLQDMILARKVLDDEQRASLLLWLHWCLNTPQSLDDIHQNLSSMEMPMRERISQILIRVAYADGILDDREVASLRELHKALGLPSTWLDMELARQKYGEVQMPSTDAIEKASLQIAQRDGDVYEHASSTHKNRDSVDVSADLNMALASICESAPIQDLQKIFSSDPGQNDSQRPERDIQIDVAPVQFSSPSHDILDEDHVALLAELIQNPLWPRLQFFKTAIKYELMGDRVIELFNELSRARFKAPMIIDGDCVQIDIPKATQLYQNLS